MPSKTSTKVLIGVATALVLAIALGAGIGAGLKHHNNANTGSSFNAQDSSSLSILSYSSSSIVPSVATISASSTTPLTSSSSSSSSGVVTSSSHTPIIVGSTRSTSSPAPQTTTTPAASTPTTSPVPAGGDGGSLVTYTQTVLATSTTEVTYSLDANPDDYLSSFNRAVPFTDALGNTVSYGNVLVYDRADGCYAADFGDGIEVFCSTAAGGATISNAAALGNLRSLQREEAYPLTTQFITTYMTPQAPAATQPGGKTCTNSCENDGNCCPNGSGLCFHRCEADSHGCKKCT